MTARWRIGLLAAATGLLLAANHWRAWWLPTAQVHMEDEPCPGDKRIVATDLAGLCVYRADNSRLIAARAQPRLVLFGDSILGDWQTFQPGLFGQDWINRGIGGQTSGQLLTRMRQDVIALQPRTVLIEAGINDVIALRGVIGPDDLLANLESLVDLAEAHRIRVIVATMPPVARFPTRPRLPAYPRIEQLNQRIRAMAARRGLVLADFHAALQAPDRPGPRADQVIDGVHPNATGYARLEPVVRQALARAEEARP